MKPKPKLTDRMNRLIGGSPSLGVKKTAPSMPKPVAPVLPRKSAFPKAQPAPMAKKMPSSTQLNRLAKVSAVAPSKLATTKMKPQLIRKKF